MSKIKSLATRFAFASLWVAAAAVAHAQDCKIAFVNADRVLREANASKAAEAKFEVEFGKRDRDLNDQANALKAASQKFEREGPTLSDSVRAQRQRQLVDTDRELQRKRREFQEDLNARRNEELQGLVDRANRIIRQVAETEKCDAILENGLYINPKLDMTDKVIKALNAATATGAPAMPSSAAPSK